MTIKTINPTTGDLIKTYQTATPDEIQAALAQAEAAFSSWRQTDFETRAAVLRRAAQLLREGAMTYGRLMTEEMGKPLKDGRSEAQKCAWVCDYYADHAEKFLAPEMVETDFAKSYVSFQPLGPVLAIMPWNFPFWQVFRFAAPALMAGNVALLKHAPNVSGCALAIAEIFKTAGLSEHVFTPLIIEVEQVEAIIADSRIKAVTLTGSTRAGKAVAQQAGAALKKTVLELGGSDPYIILADADLETAAKTCVASRLTNSGQSCIAAKRFIVVESVLEAFTEYVVATMQKAKMGDPMDEATEIGPQARFDLRDNLHRQVQESIAKGAIALIGGRVPEGTGAFYPPTVLTRVAEGMPAYKEELFGPVAAIIPVQDEAEAIRVANDSAYGLGGAIFTQNLAHGQALAETEIHTGACFVNDFVRSDPRLPFGGINESGYGRELAHFGIKEFVNIKTVCVR